MDSLSDKHLVEAYIKAKELKLDPRFIELLETELKRRSICIHPDIQKYKKE